MFLKNKIKEGEIISTIKLIILLLLLSISSGIFVMKKISKKKEKEIKIRLYVRVHKMFSSPYVTL